VITTETKRINLNEINIQIQPLDRVDAAKILIQDSKDKLQKKYLDCYELANHEIFDQFQLSP